MRFDFVILMMLLLSQNPFIPSFHIPQFSLLLVQSLNGGRSYVFLKQYGI